MGEKWLRNLSRIVGILFHYPPPRKPVLRRRFNIKTRALSARTTNINFNPLPHSTPSASISSISSPTSATCGSVISSPDVINALEQRESFSSGSAPPSMRVEYLSRTCEAIEQTQSTQRPENAQLHYESQPSKPSFVMRPRFFISGGQEQQPIPPHYTQFPTSRTEPSYQKQHFSVYNPQSTVPAPSNASELLSECIETDLDMMNFQDFQQQQVSDRMDLDCPQLPTLERLHRPLAQEQYTSSSLESTPPAFSSFRPPLHQFANGQSADAPQSWFPSDASRFSSSGCSSPHAPPELECIMAPPSASTPTGTSLPPPQPIATEQPAPAVPYAPEWTRYQPPATLASVSQYHIVPLLQAPNATETLTFNVLPDTATPQFDFSCHAVSAIEPCSDHTEFMSTGDVSLDTYHAWQRQRDSAEDAQSLGPSIQLSQTLPAPTFRPLPEVIIRPPSPADSVRAIGEITTSLSIL
ncbi:hypothetical protein BJV74DRAFT_367962 [Russula compacta]|nr:hypothetical protein BJV74DRAFT_367962 [Russula compacta]